jgi:uncharacterized damage-inducible protein DinB
MERYLETGKMEANMKEKFPAEAEKTMRKQLLELLDGKNAHMDFNMIVAEMDSEAVNRRLPHFNYSIWHLLEHMRRAQKDILKFIKNPDYETPPYSEFWPDQDERADAPQWHESVKQFRAGLDNALSLVQDPETDFFGPIPHASDYTIFREILLIADHNAYHLGELMTMRQALDILPPEKW